MTIMMVILIWIKPKKKPAAFLNVSEATVGKYLLEGRTCNGYIIMLKPLA